MDQDPADSGTQEETSPDIEAASDTLASDLFPPSEDVESEGVESEESEPADEPGEVEPKQEPITREPPKSWKKEMRESFAKLDPETQEYIELREKQMSEGLDKDRGDALLGRTLRDTITPYNAILQSQGVNEQQAVQYLLNAHYRLTQGSPEDRHEAYRQLGKNLGMVQDQPSEAVDPTIQALRSELDGIKHHLSSGQQASLQAARSHIERDVGAFASDPAHPYFDEVADDTIMMLNSGLELKDAYDKAVWANPITRQKEISRLQTEAEGETRKKAMERATAAKKASSVNINSRDTKRTPTGPKATMNDLDSALRETMLEIKSRS